MKRNICNVVTIVSGIIEEVKSFYDSKKAEAYFIEEISLLENLTEEDIDYFLNEGYFQKGKKELTIIWST